MLASSRSWIIREGRTGAEGERTETGRRRSRAPKQTKATILIEVFIAVVEEHAHRHLQVVAKLLKLCLLPAVM